jgi:hypothetical protein
LLGEATSSFGLNTTLLLRLDAACEDVPGFTSVAWPVTKARLPNRFSLNGLLNCMAR